MVDKMNKKILLLSVLILVIIISSAQEPNLHTLTPEGLSLDPESLLYSQISQSDDLSQFLSVGNIIQNPSSLLASELASQLNQEYKKILETSEKIMDYAEESNIKDYEAEIDDDGVVTNAKIIYKTEEGDKEVNLENVEANEDGEFSCKEDCSLTIGKNSYMNIDPETSNFNLDKKGNLVSANFTVTEETEMFFGDRRYKVQEGTDLNYILKTDEEGNEYYEINIQSEKEEGIDFSFPVFDEEGNEIPKNYKISGGNVVFTEDGMKVFKGSSVEDTNLKYKMTNNGNNYVFITHKRENLPERNYLLANEDEFEFSLQQSDISIYEGNAWDIDIPKEKSLDIEISSFGKGHIDTVNVENGYLNVKGGKNALVNDGGSFVLKNCDSVKRVTEDNIFIEAKGSGKGCSEIALVTGTSENMVIDDGKDVWVCDVDIGGFEEIQSGVIFESYTGYFSYLTGKQTNNNGNCRRGATELDASDLEGCEIVIYSGVEFNEINVDGINYKVDLYKDTSYIEINYPSNRFIINTEDILKEYEGKIKLPDGRNVRDSRSFFFLLRQDSSIEAVKDAMRKIINSKNKNPCVNLQRVGSFSLTEKKEEEIIPRPKFNELLNKIEKELGGPIGESNYERLDKIFERAGYYERDDIGDAHASTLKEEVEGLDNYYIAISFLKEKEEGEGLVDYVVGIFSSERLDRCSIYFVKEKGVYNFYKRQTNGFCNK